MPLTRKLCLGELKYRLHSGSVQCKITYSAYRRYFGGMHLIEENVTGDKTVTLWGYQ